MAFTFDAKTPAGGTDSTGLTVSHTCNASAKLIVVCLAVRGAPTTPAVTYAGASLTRAVRAFDAGDAEYAEIYYKVSPATGANNVVVSGIPLIALKGRRFRIGDVVLEGTDSCDPCSRMETALGPGGYNAMRGMGGLCARIVEGGTFGIGDPVAALDPVPVDDD